MNRLCFDIVYSDVTVTSPSLNSSLSSYIAFPNFRVSVLTTTNVVVRFRAESPTGILLYLSQYATVYKEGGDFFLVALRNFQLLFQFNLGSGLVQGELPVELNTSNWYTARVNRQGRTGKPY